MKSINNFGDQPRTKPLLADEILEFHAARLLLLLNVCGKGGVIDSLTKMAKLDFFVRYPSFFSELCEYLGETTIKTGHSLAGCRRTGPRLVNLSDEPKIHETRLRSDPEHAD